MPTAHKVLSRDALLLGRDENSDSEKAETAQLRSYGEGDGKESGGVRECLICETLGRLRAQSQRRREMARSVCARKAGQSGGSFRTERKRMRLALGLSSCRKAAYVRNMVGWGAGRCLREACTQGSTMFKRCPSSPFRHIFKGLLLPSLPHLKKLGI